jgi:hypothetical protein
VTFVQLVGYARTDPADQDESDLQQDDDECTGSQEPYNHEGRLQEVGDAQRYELGHGVPPLESGLWAQRGPYRAATAEILLSIWALELYLPGERDARYALALTFMIRHDTAGGKHFHVENSAIQDQED